VNGIDFETPAHEARPTEFDSKLWNAVLVGRLEPVKGIEFAIRAIADPRVPSHVCLWIVGDGPLRDSLEVLVASLGLASRVRFAGFRRNAVAFITYADALMMPSLHEGLPYTLLEAVAARTAVIASDVGGLSEVLADGRTALLTLPRDVDALAVALSRMASEPVLATQLAEAAYAALSQKHTVERMGEAYLALYRQLGGAGARGIPTSDQVA